MAIFKIEPTSRTREILSLFRKTKNDIAQREGHSEHLPAFNEILFGLEGFRVHAKLGALPVGGLDAVLSGCT